MGLAVRLHSTIMATEAQINANRQNALLSTGPKTPEGKAESALNANRHIGLSRSVLLKTESRDKFCALIQTYYDEHNPQTATERTLVDMMATARWRQIRMTSLEAATVGKSCDRQKNETTDAAEVTGDAYKAEIHSSRILDLYGRGEARLQRQWDSAFDRLLQLQKLRSANDAEHDPSC